MFANSRSTECLQRVKVVGYAVRNVQGGGHLAGKRYAVQLTREAGPSPELPDGILFAARNDKVQMAWIRDLSLASISYEATLDEVNQRREFEAQKEALAARVEARGGGGASSNGPNNGNNHSGSPRHGSEDDRGEVSGPRAGESLADMFGLKTKVPLVSSEIMRRASLNSSLNANATMSAAVAAATAAAAADAAAAASTAANHTDTEDTNTPHDNDGGGGGGGDVSGNDNGGGGDDDDGKANEYALPHSDYSDEFTEDESSDGENNRYESSTDDGGDLEEALELQQSAQQHHATGTAAGGGSPAVGGGVLSTPRVRRGSDSDGGSGDVPAPQFGTARRTSSGGKTKTASAMREVLERQKSRILKMAEAEKMQPKHRLFDYFTIVTKNNPGGRGASGTGGMPKLTCVLALAWRSVA